MSLAGLLAADVADTETVGVVTPVGLLADWPYQAPLASLSVMVIAKLFASIAITTAVVDGGAFTKTSCWAPVAVVP